MQNISQKKFQTIWLKNQVNFCLTVLLITDCLDHVPFYEYFILASEVVHDNLVVKFLAK